MNKVKAKKPDVFTYHDCRKYLADQCAYLKATVPGFNMAKLAKQAELSKGYLSMVFKGKWKLTAHALDKVFPHLSITAVEQNYLRFLCALENAKSNKEKAQAIEAMHKLRGYQKNHPKEALVIRYFSQWYNVAIRELAYLPEFKLDAKWIQAHLRETVPLGDIEKAIEFLTSNEFLKVGKDGKVQQNFKTIECMDQVFKAVMLSYHEQVFRLALQQMPQLESQDKNLTAYMTALSPESFAKVKSMLNETLEKIIRIGEEERKPQTLYQFSLLGFSLTQIPK